MSPIPFSIGETSLMNSLTTNARIVSRTWFLFALLSSFLAALSAHRAFAGDQIGTLTQVEGEVTLYRDPSKSLHKDNKGLQRALFQGEYYLVVTAKIGDRVEHGNIVRTSPRAKARIVYDNGDQFNVGPGTSFRIFWDKDTAKGNTEMTLAYGKLRGIIAKGGPRSRLQIRTKAATMGVRGTDFFIAKSGSSDEMEVSILRGSVELRPAAPESKPIEVKTGFSATVTAAPAPKPGTQAKTPSEDMKPLVAPVVELRKTTQEDLMGIQKSSKIVAAPATPSAEMPKEVAQQIEKLETQAVKTTLQDVKQHDPQLYAKLETQQIKSTDMIHTTTVETLLQVAPKAPTKRKPSISELENLDEGAYEKYFKVVE